MSMLMKRPTDEELRERYYGVYSLDSLSTKKIYGRDMKDEKYHCGETTWTLPKEVEGKIEDDKPYFIWYRWTDSADYSDSSMHYHVYYIEEW